MFHRPTPSDSVASSKPSDLFGKLKLAKQLPNLAQTSKTWWDVQYYIIKQTLLYHIVITVTKIQYIYISKEIENIDIRVYWWVPCKAAQAKSLMQSCSLFHLYKGQRDEGVENMWMWEARKSGKHQSFHTSIGVQISTSRKVSWVANRTTIQRRHHAAPDFPCSGHHRPQTVPRTAKHATWNYNELSIYSIYKCE